MASPKKSKKGFSQYKVVLLGQTGVGKTNLVLRYVDGDFQDGSKSTIGAALSTKLVTVEDAPVPTKLEIWDTAGQERFATLAPLYYRGAHAAVVVYDITDQESWAKAKVWIAELEEKGPEGIKIALAGNKSDLENNRHVPSKEVEEYAAEHGYIWMETSAKTGDKVSDLFFALVKTLPPDAGMPASRNSILDTPPPRKGGCCSRG